MPRRVRRDRDPKGAAVSLGRPPVPEAIDADLPDSVDEAPVPGKPVDLTSAEAGGPVGDDDAALWVPFRSWLQQDRSRMVLVWAIALLGIQATFRGFVMFGGWFLYDDLSFIERAATQPLWSTSYLFTSWNGHVMPGAFAWVHLLTSLWPLNYVPVAISGLAMEALAGVAMYALLAALFGRRPAILVPLALYLFGTITLPATLWWAAALNQLPGITAVTLALLGQVHYHRTGRLRYGLLGVVSFVAGLLFSEKVMLAVPAVFLLTLLYFTPGPPWRRLRDCLRSHFALWVSYAVIASAYFIYYVVAVPSPVNGHPNAVVALKTMGVNLIYAIIPAIFGGPFTWEQLGVGGIASPPAAVVFIGAVVTALLVAWSVMRRHRAIFGWLIIAGYWAANSFILGMTRAPWVGPVIGREYRYSTDLAVIITVFGGLAWLPLYGQWKRGTPQHLIARRGASTTEPTPRNPIAGLPTVTESGLALGMTIALVVSALISTMAFDTDWRNEVTPRFMNTIRGDLGSAHRRVTMADLILPNSAAPSGAVLGVSTHTAVAAMPNSPLFLKPGTSSDNLYMVDDIGHVRQVWVDGFSNAEGPEPGCGWRVGPEPVVVPLRGTTMNWQWYVQIDYIASLEADTTVTVGTVATKVHVNPGVNSLYLMSEGAVSDVRFSGLTYGSLCTDSIAVGFAKPLAQTHP